MLLLVYPSTRNNNEIPFHYSSYMLDIHLMFSSESECEEKWNADGRTDGIGIGIDIMCLLLIEHKRYIIIKALSSVINMYRIKFARLYPIPKSLFREWILDAPAVQSDSIFVSCGHSCPVIYCEHCFFLPSILEEVVSIPFLFSFKARRGELYLYADCWWFSIPLSGRYISSTFHLHHSIWLRKNSSSTCISFHSALGRGKWRNGFNKYMNIIIFTHSFWYLFQFNLISWDSV